MLLASLSTGHKIGLAVVAVVFRTSDPSRVKRVLSR